MRLTHKIINEYERKERIKEYHRQKATQETNEFNRKIEEDKKQRALEKLVSNPTPLSKFVKDLVKNYKQQQQEAIHMEYVIREPQADHTDDHTHTETYYIGSVGYTLKGYSIEEIAYLKRLAWRHHEKSVNTDNVEQHNRDVARQIEIERRELEMLDIKYRETEQRIDDLALEYISDHETGK